MWYVAPANRIMCISVVWSRSPCCICDVSYSATESHLSDGCAIFMHFTMEMPVLASTTNTLTHTLADGLCNISFQFPCKTGTCKTCCFSSFTITHNLWCTTKWCAELQCQKRFLWTLHNSCENGMRYSGLQHDINNRNIVALNFDFLSAKSRSRLCFSQRFSRHFVPLWKMPWWNFI